MILLVPLAFVATLAAAGYGAVPWRLSLVAAVPFVFGIALLVVGRRSTIVLAGLACLAVALGLLRLDVQRLAAPPAALSEVAAAQRIDAVRGVIVDTPVPRDRAQQAR